MGIVILALSACQMELQDVHSGPHSVGLYVGGSETRTEMLPDGLSAVWNAGDELAVWARNSSGSFALSNQLFKTYGIDGQHGFFTSVLAEAMPDDEYTYFCCYPAPVSVDGTVVTFDLPAVQDGKVSRNAQIRVVRDGIVVYEDKIASLRRFKDDVREVAQGYECGIGLEKFNDLKTGDILEAFIMEEVKQ